MRPQNWMDPDFPKERTGFVFSDPAGRRWPRLRLTLLFGGVAAFVAAVFFVQTLFVTPQLRLPFSLRQLKGQLKALQKKNPAGQLPRHVPLWQKFLVARAAAKKTPASASAAAPRKWDRNEVRMGFYSNGDPYSYKSLEEHAGQLTHLCPEWFALVDGARDFAGRRRRPNPRARRPQRSRPAPAPDQSAGR
jgi:hypothetical protein